MIPAAILVVIAVILLVAVVVLTFAWVLNLRKDIRDLASVVDRHIIDNMRHTRPADPTRTATPGLN